MGGKRDVPIAKLAYHVNCWGPLAGHPVGVTSIKDLTYLTIADVGVACRAIAEAGYSGVEFFDGNLLAEGDEIERALASSKLQLVAVYSGANFIFDDVLDEEFWRIERAASRAADLGAVHLVVGGGAKRAAGKRSDDEDKLAAGLDRVVAIARQHGLAPHYHPHLTTLGERPEEIERIFARTSIGFCPDTAHLAAAGGDVETLVRAHRDRITYIHLKGLRRQPFAFTPLNQGDLDLAPVIRLLRDTGFDGWMTVELDAWPDPAGGAQASFRLVTEVMGT